MMDAQREALRRMRKNAAAAKAGVDQAINADGMEFSGEELSEPMDFSGEELTEKPDAVTGNNIDMGAEKVTGNPSDPMDSVLALADEPRKPFNMDDRIEPLREPASRMDAPSAATSQARLDAQPQDGGFNFFRGLWAASGGSLSDYDAQKKWEKEAPLREQQRREAKQLNDLRAQSMEGDNQDRAMKRKLALAAMDPASPDSRQRQGEYRALMLSRANVAKNAGMTDLADTYLKEAERAASMSATQIERASNVFGTSMKEAMSGADMLARQNLAKQNSELRERSAAAQERSAAATEGLRNAEFGFKKQVHADTMADKQEARQAAIEAKRTEKEEKKAEQLPPGAGYKEHEQEREGLRRLTQAESLLPKLRHLGWGAETLNNLLSKSSITDIRNPEEREFAILAQWITAPERKEMFGAALSKYDIRNAGELFPALSKSPQQAKAIIGELTTAARHKISADRKLFPGLQKLDDVYGAFESAPVNSSSGGTIKEGTIIKNSKTGERMRREGGQWVKVQ